MLFRDYLKNNAQTWPDRLAYVSRSGRFTWGETADRVWRIAAALQHLGVRKGDVVATLSLDTQEVVEIWLASCTIGAVRTGINFRYAPREIAHVINDAGVKVLIVQDECEPLFRSIDEDMDSLVAVVGFGNHGFGLDYDKLLSTYDPALHRLSCEGTTPSLCPTQPDRRDYRRVLYGRSGQSLRDY